MTSEYNVVIFSGYGEEEEEEDEDSVGNYNEELTIKQPSVNTNGKFLF
jgi:predicted AlkP superfamily pyrophosphatase or phosphodiesterase